MNGSEQKMHEVIVMSVLPPELYTLKINSIELIKITVILKNSKLDRETCAERSSFNFCYLDLFLELVF